jgi:hypothetical protein
MSVPSITVDLERLIPLDCTPAFSTLLGYPSETLCLTEFHRINHFKGYNLLQLAALAPQQIDDGIEIVDCRFATVGRVARVSTDRDPRAMTIYAECSDQPPQVPVSSERELLDTCLPLLETCLMQEGIQSGWQLEEAEEILHCSICSESADKPLPVARIVIPDYRPGLSERQGLLERDYSLQQPGKASAWRLLFRYLHQAGYHVNISVNPDSALVLALALTPGLPEHRHG